MTTDEEQRKEALRLAVTQRPEELAEATAWRAQVYYRFLKGEEPIQGFGVRADGKLRNSEALSGCYSAAVNVVLSTKGDSAEPRSPAK